MRIVIALILIMLPCTVFAQRLEIESELTHKGAFPTRDNKTYDDSLYCAVIDVVLPGVGSVDFESDLIVETQSITGRKRLFVRVPSKPKDITLYSDNFQPFSFKISKEQVASKEIYEIVLRKEEQPQQQSVETVGDAGFMAGYAFTPSAPVGFSAGYCKDFGAMVSGGFSFLAFDKININQIYSPLLLTEGQKAYLYYCGKYRFYLHACGIIRAQPWLLAYAGGGYGVFADVSGYEDYYFAPSKHNGGELSLGVMIKINRLSISCGYVRNVGEKDDFQEIAVGAGFWF